MASYEVLDTGETTVIFVNESQKVEWNHKATKEVLKLYDEKLDLLESGAITTMRELWILVSKDMIKSGYYYTAAQCDNKWTSLKRKYRNKFGSCKRVCPFEDEITKILRKKPVYSISGLYTHRKKSGRNDGTLENSLNNSDASGDDTDSSENVHNIEITDDLGNAHGQPLESTGYIIQDASQDQISAKLSKLRKVVSKHNKVSSEHLRQINNTNLQIEQCLDGSTQRHCESLALKETRIEQQNEVIKQMKIRSSLLQKLLEKRRNYDE